MSKYSSLDLEILVNKYRSELIRQKLINANLQTEIAHLHSLRLQDRRLRYAVRNLLLSIDSAILYYLKTLNRPRSYRHGSLQVSGMTTSRPQELIDILHEYDRSTYSTKTINTRFIYVIAVSAYTAIKYPFRLMKKILIHGRRVA